jgi:hypothetical protein
MALTSDAMNEQELADVCGGIERDVLMEVVGVVAGNAAGALSEIVEQIEARVPGHEESVSM